MKEWYDSITPNQKVFLFLVSIPLIFLWGVGLIVLAVLIYLELGAKDPIFSFTSKLRHPKPGDPDYSDWANRTGKWADD